MSLLRRKILAGLTAVAAAAGLVVSGATPAAAGTVTVNYICGPLVISGQTFTITITLPAATTRGQAVTVTSTLVSTHPVHMSLPAGDYQGRLTVPLGGAATGSVTISNMASPPLQPGDPWRLTGSTQTTFTTAGSVTLRPGNFLLPSHQMSCIPANTASVPVAATIQVS